MFPDYSRSRLKEWIIAGRVKVDGKTETLPKLLVQEGQEIEIQAEVINDEHFEPQNIPLEIVYSDEHILIINKPAGLVVHPGAGCHDGTLLNAVLYHFPQTAEVPRAGIVHRLDKDTSGLMVVALDIEAQNRLVKAISRHNVVREYEAVVCGHMTAGGVVDKPIGRHPRIRTNMAVMPTVCLRNSVPIPVCVSDLKPDEPTRSGFICPISTIRWSVISSTATVQD